jgi:flagellar basal body-associated protein FliL
MKKKGMELSLNTVIIAVILIIVLVVVVYIFVQRSNIFGKSLEGPTCNDRGGTIKPVKEGCPSDKYLIYINEKDQQGKTQLIACCVPIESKSK